MEVSAVASPAYAQQMNAQSVPAARNEAPPEPARAPQEIPGQNAYGGGFDARA